MWNPVMKLFTEKGGLLAKVVPKHEHSIYMDQLASIPVVAKLFKN